jgi:integrase
MITITILDFATLHSKHLWHGKHQKTSLEKIRRFSQFSDNFDRPIDDYKPVHLYAYRDHLLHSEYNRKTGELGLNNATVNRYISCLSKVFSLAVEFGEMNSAPKNPKTLKEIKGRPRYFTPAEIEKLKMFYRKSKFSYMEHFIELALATGMRKAELLGINQTEESLHPDFKTYGVVSNSGDSVTLRETKTGEPRTVPLSKRARAALTALGEKPFNAFDHHNFYDHWAAGRRAVAPNDKDFVFHVCRHTCATRLANDMNINIAVIGEVLGHSSIATTQKYIHATPTHLAEIMEAV